MSDSIDNIPVIAVDGPGASGKGTLSARLAKTLGWNFLDSGAIYRVLALATELHQVDIKNEAAIAELAKQLDIQFNVQTGEIYLEGRPVRDLVRSETCGNIASQIATFPSVRVALLDYQRAFATPPGLVADGRDMGTVVFPYAFLKIYLEACPADRARRRYYQLKDKGFDVNLQSLLAEIKERDERDKQRVASPLIKAWDAVVVDTTGIGVEEVFKRVMKEVEHKLNK